MNKIPTLNFWRRMALIVLWIGAVGSLCLMLNAGRKTPVFLLVLFVGWVLSPFAALLGVDAIYKHGSVITRASIYWLMLFLAVGSLVSYGGLYTLPGTKPAFIFLVVPSLSWLLILLVVTIAQRISGRNKRV